MSQLLERITINPKQCGGRPCIRGMRIRVSDVLDLFAAGLSADEILTEMSDLEADDLKAALSYASHKLNHLESNNSVLVSNNNKKKYLLDSLTNNTDKEKNYTLYLVSCYFNPESAKSIISDLLNEEIKLSNVKIFIDRGTAIGQGKNKLLKWQTKLSNDFQLNIDLQAVNSNDLFHVKAYFLKENNNTHGNLVIGSANLTDSGLIKKYGNTELLFHISDVKFYNDFNQKLDNLVQKSAISLSNIDEFKDDFQDLNENEKIYFKFSVLNSGVFIAYDGMTTDFLLLKYECNEKWKQDNLKSQDNKRYSHSEDYFKIDKELKKTFISYNRFHSIDWGKHAIQTTLGHWIPRKLVEYLENWDNNLECKNKYREEINKLWNQNLENSQVELILKNEILKYISNNWLKEKWFESIPGIKKIHKKGINNNNLVAEISQEIAELIIDQKRNDLISELSEKKLLLRYKILDRSMFVDCDYKNIINYVYNELIDKNKNGNKKVFKVIKLAEKYCDPSLIDKKLEADDFLFRYSTFFHLSLYFDLYNIYIQGILYMYY